MRKQQLAIIALALWLILVSSFMILTHMVEFDIFFVLCIIGFFVIMQFMQSYFVQPGYLRHIRYLIVAGIIILAVIVALKVVDILGFEIVLL